MKTKKSSEAELNKIKRRIDAVAKERPSHKDVLAFLKEVVEETFNAKPEFRLDTIDLDEGLVTIKREEGFPVVDKKDLKLDIASASALFKRLSERLKQNERISEDVSRIIQAVENGGLDLEQLFEKAAAEDHEYMESASDRLNLQKGLLLFLAANSLRPIFELCVEQLKEHVNQERWWRGYCPICGSKPVMAELVGSERKRFLVCSCCGYEWRFTRIKCPFCDNEERRKFKYFFTEEKGKAYRVETCQKCKKYIKTVDTNELDGEVVPLVEDIGTLYLDALARKEGYTREVPPLGLDLDDL